MLGRMHIDPRRMPMRDEQIALGGRTHPVVRPDKLDRASPYCELLICPECGVKYTTRQARRERFGHIELKLTIPHPLGENAEILDLTPVLPAVYWESRAASHLAGAYASRT
jgi:hypothetical protein